MDSLEQTIPRLVRGAAERFGDRIAIEEGDLALSFAELASASARAARAFCAAGIEPGDRVGIWAPNIHEWVLAAIGLQAAGGVLVPLNTRLKGAEAGYILEKSGARILCTVTGFLDTDYVGLLRDALGGPSAARPIAASAAPRKDHSPAGRRDDGGHHFLVRVPRRGRGRQRAGSAAARRGRLAPTTSRTSSSPPGRRESRRAR